MSESGSQRTPTLLMARRNLTRNKLRSGLAALGIVIGVIAIASLGMFGTALQSSATDSLGDIGNEIIVNPAFEEGVQSLSEDDVRQIERAASGATTVPTKSREDVVASGDEQTVATIQGIESPGDIYTASEGRLPDRHRQGAIVGAELAERMDVDVGGQITVDGETHRIIALLERESGFSPTSPNQALLLPQHTFADDEFSQVTVRAATGGEASDIAAEIESTANDREERVAVIELDEIVESIEEFFDVISSFLLGVGALSLVVAGVSILNVMLMSTVERREEIGVFRAVGIHKREVLKMLLIEAALLGAVGGIIGIAISVVVGAGVTYWVLDDIWAAFHLQNLGYLLLAFVVGILTSLLSGAYPAWKAANEHPVDALRD